MSKILAVDDDPDILLTLQVTFEAAGHEVVAVSKPRQVLETAEREVPDAIVLDIMMPEVSGWDLLEAIRRHPRLDAVPVLMLTALGDVSHRVRGIRRGADDYLVKPFEPEELLARVERLIERWQLARAKALVHDSAVLSGGGAAGSWGGTAGLEESVALLERRVTRQESLGEVELGRYQVRELLGSGAMGMVFRGWDPKLQRDVALKTIRFDAVHIARDVQIARLLEEAVASARLNHPNVVTVFDVGDQGDAAFIAMELIDGGSLQQIIRPLQGLPVDRFLPLAAGVAGGLAAAHEQGLLHRDVKPGNVLLGRDHSIKVTDFGVSEFVSKATRSADVFGTPGYLAPECIEGEAATPATDLFALGVVCYECLTGRNPFFGRNWALTLSNTVTQKPPALAVERPDLPEEAADVVHRLLAKDEAGRPASATEVADRFEEIARAHGAVWRFEPPEGEPAPKQPGTGSQLISLEEYRRRVA